MNCSRIKDLFSEYIDGQLDKEQEALVKDHLLVCSDCRDEFESMKAVIREMGSLDKIKAPDDFLETLHGRIKSDSWFQKIKAYLFIPASIRIPVELTTLATALIIAFFIFHIVPPMIPSNKTSSSTTTSKMTPLKSRTGFKDEKTAVRIQSNESVPAGAPVKSYETKAISDKSVPAPQKKQNHYGRESLSITPSELPATQTLKAAEADHVQMSGKGGGFPAPAKINEPLQMVLVLKPVFEKEPLSEERKADKGEPARFKTQAMPRMVGSMSSAEAPAGEKLKKSYEAEKKVSSYKEELLFNIKEQIKSAGGTILKTDTNKETGQPEYLLIEISGQDYQKLVEKLGESGTIQTPPAGDVSHLSEPVQVRLHILINK